MQNAPKPKRHHWWPQLQSKYWAGPDGLVNVVKADGTTFKSAPINIGVEGELYTRLELTGSKDTTIESWFSEKIEGPFLSALRTILDPTQIHARPLLDIPPKEATQQIKSLGFVVNDLYETIAISPQIRAAIVSYLAAMVVRNPRYLTKLRDFHRHHSNLGKLDLPPESVIRSVALDNMLHVMSIYEERLQTATIMMIVGPEQSDLMFSDAGFTTTEPWRNDPLPFDIHAPLTPNVALEVFPMSLADPLEILVGRLNHQGVKRMNRLTVGGAERFVFTRSPPPLAFIKKHFGVPSPAAFGHRVINGGLETIYDPSRDRPL